MGEIRQQKKERRKSNLLKILGSNFMRSEWRTIPSRSMIRLVVQVNTTYLSLVTCASFVTDDFSLDRLSMQGVRIPTVTSYGRIGAYRSPGHLSLLAIPLGAAHELLIKTNMPFSVFAWLCRFRASLMGVLPGPRYALVILQHVPHSPSPALGIRDAVMATVGQWLSTPRIGQAMAFVVQSS